MGEILILFLFQTEEMNERLERENTELSKQVTTLKLTIEKYECVEHQLSDKEVTMGSSHANQAFNLLV